MHNKAVLSAPIVWPWLRKLSVCAASAEERLKGAAQTDSLRNHVGLCSFFVIGLCLALLFPAASVAQRRRLELLPAARNYFAGKIVLIPRDDQVLQLRVLAQIADQDLILPPSRLLDPQPQPDKLIEWAKSLNLAEANGAIISLEAIAATTEGTAALRVQAIRQFRAAQARLPLYGFASLDASPASKQICQTALDLVADGTLNFLLIEQTEDLGEKPAQIARARIIGEIGTRKIEDRVAFDDDPASAADVLIARLIARRYNQAPKFLTVYSSKEGRQSTESRDTLALDQSIAAKIKLAGGALPAQQESETAPSVDLLLFVHAPQTTEEQRTGFAKVLTQTVDRGARIALVDLSRTKAAKESLVSALRAQKQLDKLAAYASSKLTGEAAGDAASRQTRESVSRALAQAVVHFIGMRSLRNDLDRVARMDRAQVTLLFSRYLQDWAYNLTVRPKLEAYAQEQKIAPNQLGEAAERAEKFVFDQLQPIAAELFNEQFSRNVHAVLLNGSERAEFRISLLQRLQVRFTSQKISEAEIKQSIHTFYEGILPVMK